MSVGNNISNQPRFSEVVAGAQNTFTKPMAVLAEFNTSISGTWSGTITLQRSFNYVHELEKKIPAGSATWMDVKTWTANAEGIGEFSEPEANVYYRLGFKTGGYTSGAALLRFSY